MKKIFSMILILAFVILTLASCANYDRNMIKIGIYTEEASSYDSDSLKLTVAAVVVNKLSGKIEQCAFDRATVSAKKDAGTLTAIAPTVESAEDVSMFTLYADATANQLIGKTFEEVAGVTASAEEISPELLASLKGAVQKADENPYSTPSRNSKDAKLGLSVIASAAVDEGGTSLSATVDVGVCVIDNGKVASAAVDCIAPEFVYEKNADGKLVFNKMDSLVSKQVLLDNYNMVAYGGAIAEWYVQAQRYADEAVGKTVAELDELPFKDVAGCTIYPGSFRTSIIDAAGKAK